MYMSIFADPSFQIGVVFATFFYSALGILLMVISVVIFDKVFGLNLKKELVEEHNTAFGMLFAGLAIAMAIIIAASITS